MSGNDDDSNRQGPAVEFREFSRGDVEIYADIREHGGNKHKTRIVDLSRSGFRLKSSTYIRDSKTIFLTIPGFAPLEARIAWHKDDLYGCEFVNRIHIAIYEHILGKFPALRKDGTEA